MRRKVKGAGTIQPLSDLRVVEWAQEVAGAVCSRALADLGADVIKVEPPEGDPARYAGPFPNDQPDLEKSGRFLSLNVNKRGITLDTDSSSGRDALLDLIREADVFVTDFRPPQLRERKVEFPELSAINSRLVMAAISPFGQTGPYRDFKGGELIAWHAGGLGYETPAHAVTDPDSQPPLKLAGQQAMHLSGWAAATGVMLALADRDSTGQGQLVDVSSMEAVANIIRGSLILHPYDVSRVGRTRQKSGFSASPMFQCKDGYVSISLSQERWWKTLIEAPGAPPELKGPDYADAGGRRLNATALEALITSWFMQYTREQLYDIFIPLHLPCFPVNSMREVTGSRQYAAREYFATQDHPFAGAVTHPGPVTRMAGVERQPRLPAPTLGGNDGVGFNDIRQSAHDESSQPNAGSDASPGKLPLEGVRVLDFGWFYAAPHTGAWLGAMGAEVIRVESAARIEYNREAANARAEGLPGINRSSIWNGVNFSKLGVTLNLSTDEGKNLARQLAGKCDIVIENFSAGVMDRLGLGYGSLSEVNPGAILLSCSTLGAFGPESKVSGLGPNIQVYAGLPHLSGYEDGPPALGGGSWPDFVVGIIGTFATLVALRDRKRTGRGQHIDLAMAEVITSMIPEAVMDYLMNGKEHGRQGNHDPEMSPHSVYPASGYDQWVAIAVSNDDEWRAMCEVAGHPEWIENPKFADLKSRKKNEAELDSLISEWTKRESPYGIMHTLQEAGVSAAPVMSVFDLVASPHLLERGYFVDIDHPEVGPRMTPGIPVKFSGMPNLNYYAAPTLGQHNEFVLKEIVGLDDATYSRLVADRVIY